tara:strand:- start:189 stop:365 length:177 start_codon:yes stop_codon:yes gene_type:complete
MSYKKGDVVTIQDGSTQRQGVVLKDGVDSKNRVRVRPKGIPLDMSISLNTSEPTYIIQ